MKTILYVDDDLNSLFLIKEQLKLINPNIKVITENRSKNVIDLFKKHINDIDLVISDIHMPYIDGYELLIMLKKLKSEIPVILITASNENKEYNYIIGKLGAEDYLIKPLLKSTINKIIEKH